MGAAGPKPPMPSCTMVPSVTASSTALEPQAPPRVATSTPWSSDQELGDTATPGRKGKTQPDGPGAGVGPGGGVAAGRRGGAGGGAGRRPDGSEPPLNVLSCTTAKRRSVAALAPRDRMW